MADITLKGNAINTIGNLPKIGSKAPNFKLTAVDLSHKSLSDFEGKKVILNIFPSIDTGTCATSVREFNKSMANLENAVVLCISKFQSDLLNQKFLLRIDCKSAKEILEKDVKNITSKNITSINIYVVTFQCKRVLMNWDTPSIR